MDGHGSRGQADTRSIDEPYYELAKPSKPAGRAQRVEFVIQILKKAAKLASEAEARRREAWAGAQRGNLAAFPRPRDAWGGGGGAPPAVRIVLGFHLYKYLCKPQEISISIVNLLRSVTTQKIVRSCRPAPVVFSPSLWRGFPR
jgi:hypothetical protein